MKHSLYIGTIAGIKLFVHWTFFILILWIIFSDHRTGLNVSQMVWSTAFILAVFVCITLHELGHALAAKRFNITTKNITLLPIGGVAQLETFPEKPKEELIVALAGPAVNVIIAVALIPFIHFTDNIRNLSDLNVIGPGNFLLALFSVNLWLPLFNLIPAFPMDGGRVFRALLAFKLDRVMATRVAATVGQVIAFGFILMGFMYNPFLIFIGLFIIAAAQTESGYAMTKSLLHGYTVSDVVMHEIPTIDSNESVKDAANKLLNSQNKNFVVMEGDRPIGTLSSEEIIDALSTKGAATSLKNIKRNDIEYLPIDMPLEEAWNKMQQSQRPLMLVKSDGHVEGILNKENLIEFIFIRRAQAAH